MIATDSVWDRLKLIKNKKRKRKQQLNVGVGRSLERSTMEIYRIEFLEEF